MRICLAAVVAMLGWNPCIDAATAAEQPMTSGAAAQAQSRSLRLLSPTRHAGQQALHAAVAAHPALLEPGAVTPATQVALALYPDGRVAASSLRIDTRRPPLTPQAIEEWIRSVLPPGSDAWSMSAWPRGTVIGEARLATDLTLYFGRVPANFDANRSDARVRRLVSRYHRDLLYTGDDTRHRLTVLLDAEGNLLARHVDRIARSSLAQPATAVPVGAWAGEVAARLQVDAAQIGLMGTTTVQDGGELYVVVYAWQRRPGEPGPQVLEPLPPRIPLDPVTAQALVDQHFPAAAAGGKPAGETPAIVLSMDGEVIRTGSVTLKHGGLTAASLQQPALKGLRIAELLVHPVRDADGRQRDALFVWQSDEPVVPQPMSEGRVQGTRR